MPDRRSSAQTLIDRANAQKTVCRMIRTPSRARNRKTKRHRTVALRFLSTGAQAIEKIRTQTNDDEHNEGLTIRPSQPSPASGAALTKTS
ncbi:hypothetical protein PCAR4_370069 [Paraburkholderia caribensis]|nr:hypothetical protein PCAR4_370069 [Paraburkholderia caribensis]